MVGTTSFFRPLVWPGSPVDDRHGAGAAAAAARFSADPRARVGGRDETPCDFGRARTRRWIWRGPVVLGLRCVGAFQGSGSRGCRVGGRTARVARLVLRRGVCRSQVSHVEGAGFGVEGVVVRSRSGVFACVLGVAAWA